MLHKSFLTIRLISFPLIPEVIKFNKENKYSEIRIVPVPSLPPYQILLYFQGRLFSDAPSSLSSRHCLNLSPRWILPCIMVLCMCGIPHSAKGSVRAWLSLVLFVSPTTLNSALCTQKVFIHWLLKSAKSLFFSQKYSRDIYLNACFSQGSRDSNPLHFLDSPL